MHPFFSQENRIKKIFFDKDDVPDVWDIGSVFIPHFFGGSCGVLREIWPFSSGRPQELPKEYGRNPVEIWERRLLQQAENMPGKSVKRKIFFTACEQTVKESFLSAAHLYNTDRYGHRTKQRARVMNKSFLV